jgi:hypothetical protein
MPPDDYDKAILAALLRETIARPGSTSSLSLPRAAKR